MFKGGEEEMIPLNQLLPLMFAVFLIIFVSMMVVLNIIYPSYKEIVTMGDSSMENCKFNFCLIKCSTGDFNYNIRLCPEWLQEVKNE